MIFNRQSLASQILVPRGMNLGSPQAKNLLAWWPLHYATGENTSDGAIRAVDSSLGGNNPADVDQSLSPGTASWTVFEDGNVWSSSWTDNPRLRVTTPTVELRDLPATHDFAIAFWFRSNGAAGGDTAISWNGTDDLLIQPHEASGQARIFWRDLGGNIITVAGAASDLTVHHFCFVSRATNDHRAFVDGVEIGSSTATGTAGPFTDFWIGGWSSTAWDGALRDVRAYNKGLTDAEIWALYDPRTRYDLFGVPSRNFWMPAGAAQSAAITGTTAPTVLESEIVTGSETTIITLTGDTFVAAGAGAIGSEADTQAIIDGVSAATTPANGWNNEVRDKEAVGSVSRDSNTQATITWTAAAAYSVAADETITVTVPAAVLVTSGVPLTATPTFTATNEGMPIPVAMNHYRRQHQGMMH